MSQDKDIVGHLIIPKDKVPAAAYQAIYHKFTSKVEKIKELFDDAYVIRVEDIAQLNDMICNTVRQYPVQGQNVVVSVSFHKDERLESTSMEKFRMLNFSTTKPTERVEYVFDFYTILPVELPQAEDILQKFKIKVMMDQDFMEEDEGNPFIIRGMWAGSNIRLEIDYSDYAVGRNLQVCVQDWVKALGGKKVPPFIKLMERQSDRFTNLSPFLFTAAALFGASGVVLGERAEFQSITRVLAFAILMFAIGRFLIVEFYRQIEMSKPLTFFNITNGDRARHSKLSKSRSRKYAVSMFLLGSIVVGIIVNLFSSFLWENII